MKGIRLQRVYPHSIERVWTALATADGIAAWLMPNDFEPRLGHRFRLRWKKQPGWRGYVDCEVVELTPPTRLAYTWQGSDRQRPSTVRWTLEPVADGTRLLLEHDGFHGFGGLFMRLMLQSGWNGRLLGRLLPAALDTLARGAPLSPRRP